ncbi:MAG: 6-carboxytetrahydropterin synthase [Bacteroidales bacterium]|nr:MAG: 6-carboxytetrahydropterin synthase [Bacteroidales bacterium]
MSVTVCRKAHFNAAHRLCNPAWDDNRNKKTFGVCSNPNYHGHNYDLIVKVSGDVDPETGFVIDMNVLKKIIEENIIKRYDHKNLNLDVDDFKSKNPTAENIAIAIWNILRAKIDSKLGLKIVLYETERNFIEYGG